MAYSSSKCDEEKMEVLKLDRRVMSETLECGNFDNKESVSREDGFKRYNHLSLNFLATKLLSYFYYGSKYLLIAYLVPFFASSGLQTSQAGLIISIRYAMQITGGFSLSLLADKWKKYKFFSILSIFMITLSMIATPFMPHLLNDVAVNNNTNNNITNKNNTLPIEEHYKSNKIVDNTSLVGSSVELRENRPQSLFSDQKKHNLVFYTLLVCCTIYAVFDGALNGLVDATTITISEVFGEKKCYYWQRLWGSIGYATVPLLGGLLLDHTEYFHLSQYMSVFYLFYALQAIVLISAIFHLQQYSRTERRVALLLDNPEQVVKGRASLKMLLKTLAIPEIAICLLLQVIFGVGTGAQFSYLLLYMEDHMTNGSKSILGFCILSQCLTEAVSAPLVGSLNVWVKDPFVIMAVGLLGYGVAFLLYYFCYNALFIIPINLIFGFSYSMFNFPAQAECYRLSSRDCLAMVFSLSAGCYTGVGCAIGGLLGGILYEEVKPRRMYLVISSIFIVVFCSLVCYCLYRRKRTNKGMGTSLLS